MIRLWDIMSDCSNAIAADATVADICSAYPGGLKMYVGSYADIPVQATKENAICFVVPSDQDYDVGFNGEDRVIALGIYWAIFGDSTTQSGNVISFNSIERADALGIAILESIKAIPELGDCASSLAYAIDESNWPHASGRAEIIFTLARGLDKEPEIT